MPSTIILVHGAFADSSTWDGVVGPLEADGFDVIAAANPLRGLASDAEDVSDVVRSVDTPVVLVGHAYGGAVITNVPADAGEIVGLVYVSAFAPDAGESCFALSARYPGGTLRDAVRPTLRRDGTARLTIAPHLFHDQFAADVSVTKTTRMAVSQRPVALAALQEPSRERPLWKDVPSWFVFGEADRCIPVALQRFMAARAAARHVVEIPGASHAIAVSQPERTAEMVLEAASQSITSGDAMALDPLSPITHELDPSIPPAPDGAGAGSAATRLEASNA